MTKMALDTLLYELKKAANPEKAIFHQRFFKTGPGEYGEGDVFMGINVPVLRRLAKQFKTLPLSDIHILLSDKIHEKRLLALFMLVQRFQKGCSADQQHVYQFYLDHLSFVNNWDLVDSSAHHIVGAYLFKQSKDLLFKWAESDNLWERRIAIMSTFYDIKQHRFETTLDLSRLLIRDKEDLIHKAVGWMIREIGKRDLACEETFLNTYAAIMPRTMLRYAIERFPKEKRHTYLRKKT